MSLNNVSVRFLTIFFAGLLFSADNLYAQKKTLLQNTLHLLPTQTLMLSVIAY